MVKPLRFSVLLVSLLVLAVSVSSVHPPEASATVAREDRVIGIGKYTSDRKTSKLRASDWTAASAALSGISNSDPRLQALTRQLWFATNNSSADTAYNWGYGARSADGGNTWSGTSAPSGGTNPGAIHFAKDAGNRVWMLVHDFPNGIVYPKSKVYYSDNSGSSWTLATTLGSGSSPQAVRAWKIVPHPTNPNIVAVIGFSTGLPNSSDQRGFILYTTDRGSNWTANYATNTRIGQAGVLQFYDAVMLPDSRIVAQGPFFTSGTQKWYTLYSTDYGANWSEGWSVQNINARANGLYADPTGSNIAFLYTPNVSAGGGQQGEHYVMLSTNSGSSFSQLSLSEELKDFLTGSTLVVPNTFAASPEGDAFYLGTALSKKIIRFSPVSSSGEWTDLTEDYPHTSQGVDNIAVVRDLFEPRNVFGGPGSSDSPQSPDPVNLATGNLSHEHVDVLIPGKGYPLSFRRAYNSQDTTDGRLGYGWQDNLNMRLLFGDSDLNHADITVVSEFGRQDDYLRLEDNTFVPPPGVHDVLEWNSTDEMYELTRKDGSVRHFDTNGVLQTIEDRNGNETTFTYTDGLLTSVQDAGGRELTFTYNDSDRIETITDPLDRIVEFFYDAGEDYLTNVGDVGGEVTSYSYMSGRLVAIDDANSHTAVENTYDAVGRVAEQTDAVGAVTCIYYSSAPAYTSGECPGPSPAPSSGQTVMVDGRGNETTFTYDSFFRQTEVEDALGNTVSYTYDDAGSLTCVTDQRGNKTGLVYDDRGNLIERIDALNTDANCELGEGGVSWTTEYRSDDQVDVETDPLGRETDYMYDVAGNLTRIVRLDDASNILKLTCFEYGNGDGLVTATVESTDLELPENNDDPCTGNTTSFEFNAYGNLIAVTDPRFAGQMDPPQRILDPDIAGRVESVTDELSHTTSTIYDNSNRPLTVTDDLGNTTSSEYDAKGNLISITDANRQAAGAPETGEDCGAAGTGDGVDDDSDDVPDDGCPNTIYIYDDADRLIEVIDALGNSTADGYDENGNRISVRNPNRAAVGDPEEGAECGAAGTGDGEDDDSDTVADDGCPSTIYEYDELNRLVATIDALGRETTFDYDEASFLIERVDARGLITDYTPDALNRIETIEYWDETHTTLVGSVDYDYDEVGNRIEMVDSTGTTTYVPDPLNRLDSVTFPGSVSVAYEYDEVGDRTRITYPSTDYVDYTYDEAHRMETVTDWLSQETVYTYDGAGRLALAELPNGVDTDYDYDNGDRLTDVVTTGPGPTTISDFHYELDAVGNRAEMTALSGTHEYVYDPLYRLTQVIYPDPETDAYTYDDDGNRLSLDSTDYTYDAADQLLTADAVSFDYDENGNQVERDSDTFEYDHENRLIEAVIDSVTSTSEYSGDGLRMSLTVDDGTPVTTDYVWDINANLPVVLDDGTKQYVYGLDLISATDSADEQVYFVYDGLGSTMALTDDGGDATDTYEYDVFGAIRASTGSTPNAWLFGGEQQDGDSGLYYLRARYYDPATGRFLSIDPMRAGYPFAYAGNNPVNFSDPTGLHCKAWHPHHCAGEIIGGAAGLVKFGKEMAKCTGRYKTPLTCYFETLFWLGSDGDKDTKEGGIRIMENCTGLCAEFLNASGAPAFTMGHSIFALATFDGPKGQDTLRHELVHVDQYELLGDTFLPAYFGPAGVGGLVACAATLDINMDCLHDRNFFEIWAEAAK